MIQRKCGTCRYFEEGGIAASGWCRHPERQDLQHMVLVRKTELACRDGWDHDLWEPAEGDTSKKREMASPVGVTAATGSGGSSLNGIQRHSRDRTSRPNGSLGEDEERSKLRDRDPSYRNEESRQEPSRRNLFSPRLPAFDNWTSAPVNDSQPNTTEYDEVRDETFSTRGLKPSSDWRRQLHELRESGTARYESVPKPAFLERQGDADSMPAAQRREGMETSGNSPSFGSTRIDDTETSRNGGRHDDSVSEPVLQSGVTEPFEFTPPEGHEPPSVLEDRDDSQYPDPPAEEVAGQASSLDEPEDVAHGGAVNLPMALQQGQCCRTCRDFLPTDGGRRGWCNNPYAFEKRQQVNADDLACRSTCGNWWSPSDDWWIERADISHHSAPTPLVDELIREIRERHTKHHGSTRKTDRS